MIKLICSKEKTDQWLPWAVGGLVRVELTVEGTFCDDGPILYLDFGGDYIGEYIYHNHKLFN